MSCRWLTLAVILLPSFAAAGDAPPGYPFDVKDFVDHAAGCVHLVKENMDWFGLSEFGCFNLDEDKERLIGRYRDKPEVVAALRRVKIGTHRPRSTGSADPLP